MKRAYNVSSCGDVFKEFFNREIGFSQPSHFSRRISASEAMVKRLDLYGKLAGHEGCVNAIDFNATGDFLVSGSDDRRVIIWDWATATSKLSYPSGHMDNIFQAKFMPFTDDRQIITASADGQVRLGLVLENGRVETKRVGKHQGRVHSLAIEPGSPYVLYSCGEDGFIRHFDLRSNSSSKLLRCSSFKENNKRSSNVRLNAIAIDPRNPNYFAVGGSDEYVRVYDTRMCQLDAITGSDRPMDTFCPHHLMQTHVHITALAYSNTSELLVSYNDELIYLYRKNMGLGPAPLPLQGDDLDKPQVYSGHRNAQTVKGVCFFGLNDEYVLTGSDCGHIFMWKKKDAKLIRMMVGDRHIVNQLRPHPSIPVLATCGIEKTIKLWAPTSNDVTPLPPDVQEIMEANRRGREDHSRVALTPDVVMHVLRLHRRQPLVYTERPGNTEDVDESDEDDEDSSYMLGFSDGETGENSECNIS